jgi:Ser/Thr protein kinase RdoA (MazF antagonist)
MMSQMGGMMTHMVDMIQGGTMTPEQVKQLGDMMGHMADMMRKLPDMKTADVPQQITPMMERMTEMQKQMMSIMAAPKPAPPAASPQEKK